MVRVDGRKWSDNFLVISELLAGSFNGKWQTKKARSSNYRSRYEI